MKNIVVCGSSFIGSNLINYLLQYKFNILHIDIKEPIIEEQREIWKALDILDLKKLKVVIEEIQPNYIIYLAARTDLNGNNVIDYTVNTLGTENLIKAYLNVKSLKRAILMSSILVCKTSYIPNNYDEYCADTIYSQSKVEMKKIIKNSQIEYEWIFIRPTSIWNPWFKEPYNKFFKIVLKGLFSHPEKKVSTKTYGFVENSIYQLLVIDKDLVNRKTFYIGGRSPINISAWADEIKMQYNNQRNIVVPYSIFKILAKIGDILTVLKI